MPLTWLQEASEIANLYQETSQHLLCEFLLVKKDAVPSESVLQPKTRIYDEEFVEELNENTLPDQESSRSVLRK